MVFKARFLCLVGWIVPVNAGGAARSQAGCPDETCDGAAWLVSSAKASPWAPVAVRA